MQTILKEKILLSFIFAAWICCLPELSNAKNAPLIAQLKIAQLKCLNLTEHGKDEVYFEIKSVNKKGKFKIFRVPPTHPITVPISEGFTIKNGILLEQKLEPGESITLIISLLESDNSNLNPDDLIGAAEVTLSNHNSQIKTKWGIPKTNYDPKTKINDESEYIMNGGGGSYKLRFEVVPISAT